MAIINACFITFLSLKNTPLAYLTAYSHERLNILHQVGGYTTVIYALLHGTMQSYTWVHQMKRPAMLLELANVCGILAASAMFVTAVSAIIIRHIRYEVFYVIHIAMYIVILVALGLHQPNFAGKAIIVTILMACMWGSDRLLRSWRIFWYSYDNKAIITPLVNGGTRIRLQRAPTRATPGAHCFLWIPKIRAFETHPFTIVSKTTSSLEFVISAYDGFTNDLHAYAVKHPGTALRASIDGPYGAIPDFAETADKIILVAGGSGASFTFGVACDVIRRLRDSSKTTIEFIWTVREQGKHSHLFIAMFSD
jgi:predicted ferric reductase